MIDLKITLTAAEIDKIESSTSRKSLLVRIKQITGLYHNNLYNYIEENCDCTQLIKCGFCGSIKRFDSFNYEVIENKLYITYEYNSQSLICGRKDNDITINCGFRKLNSNSKEFVKIAFNFSTLEEAGSYILARNKSPFYKHNHKSEEDYKKYQRRNAEFFGSEERYNEYRKNMSIGKSEEEMIKRHGQEKYLEICKSKDSSSPDYFKRKYGDNWEIEFNKKNNLTNSRLETFINRYGLDEGTLRFNNFSETARINSNRYFKSLTAKERKLIFGVNSKDYFKRKHGENWEAEYKNYCFKTQSSNQVASNESLKFFNLLIEKLDKKIKYNIGVPGNDELFLYDENTHRIKLYDFCIPKIMMIIEFHGSIWHFNPSYDYTRKLPFGFNLEQHKINDAYKQNLAESHGYDYYAVFDTDNYALKAEELFSIIEEKLKIN